MNTIINLDHDETPKCEFIVIESDDECTPIKPEPKRSTTASGSRTMVPAPESLNIPIIAPAIWTKDDTGGYPLVQRVYGDELDFVVDRWEAGGLKRSAVVSVHRVQNGRLYSAYMTERNAMAQGAEDEQVVFVKRCVEMCGPIFLQPISSQEAANEDCLFHGADTESIKNITRSGFDMRVAASGGLLGSGNYFANRSAYSRSYSNSARHWNGVAPGADGPAIPGLSVAHGQRLMILARVALGRVGPANPGFKVPHAGYDSAASGDICCVFKNELAYPEWVIVFDNSKA